MANLELFQEVYQETSEQDVEKQLMSSITLPKYKKLKKAKFTLTRDDNSVWCGTFDADNFVFGSFKLPEGEEMNPDEIFADRVRALAVFRQVLIEYFKLFASSMLADRSAVESAMRQWISNREAI